MKKFWAGFLTGILSSIVAVYLFTVLAVPSLININQYKGDIEKMVQSFSHIDFTIERLDFDIDWALNLKLSAKNLKVSKLIIVDNIAVETPAIDIIMGKQNLQLKFISELEKAIKKNITPEKAVKKILQRNLNNVKLNFSF